MKATLESARARRYLLGEASHDECEVIEREYLQSEEAVGRIAAAEDDLIEDYLADQLSTADRDGFERAYLAAPHHRIRVEAVRRLMAHGSRSNPANPVNPAKVSAFSLRAVTHRGPWLALAASLLIVASVALWRFSVDGRRPADVADNRPSQPTAPAARDRGAPPANAPRIFAVTISPATVRSASESPSLVIPAGTEVVALRLETDGDARTLVARRASIRTVGGREVWQGAVTTESDPPPGTVARLDVPAATVPADDYLVSLYGTDRTGAEAEWMQYFLRVRAR